MWLPIVLFSIVFGPLSRFPAQMQLVPPSLSPTFGSRQEKHKRTRHFVSFLVEKEGGRREDREVGQCYCCSAEKMQVDIGG